MSELLAQVDLIGTGPVADRARPGIMRALQRELSSLQSAAAGDDLDAAIEQHLADTRSVTWCLCSAINADPFVDEDAFHLAVLRLHHAVRRETDNEGLLDAWRLLKRQLPWTDAWRLCCDYVRGVLAQQKTFV